MTSTASSQPNPPTQRSPFAIMALPIAAAALALSACNVDIEFDDESVVREFDVETFDSISIDAPFDVTIRQGSSQSLAIEIGENRLDDLIIEVVNGELRIDLDSGNFNIGTDLVATITVTDLESLHASSASDVVIANIDVDDLVMKTDEASQVSISGTIETLTLDMSEASDADLDGTTISTVTLEMSGASSADFPDTVGEINGSISGASSLDVDDATSVRVDTSGASSIDRN